MSSLLIPPPEDPVRAAAQWLGEAEALGRRNANAMALACVDAAGRPSVRMVLLKELAPLGLCRLLYELRLAQGSRARRDGRAAAVLYWHELGRQVRFEGPRRALARRPRATAISRAGRCRARSTPGAASRAGRSPTRPRSRNAPPRSPPRQDGHEPASSRVLGRIPLVARSRRAVGRRPRTAFTSACATSAASTRAMPIRSSRAAGIGSACNPSATASRRLIQFETITCPYCWESIEIARRSVGRGSAASRGLLGLLPADRHPLQRGRRRARRARVAAENRE